MDPVTDPSPEPGECNPTVEEMRASADRLAGYLLYAQPGHGHAGHCDGTDCARARCRYWWARREFVNLLSENIPLAQAVYCLAERAK